ncbi:MAG: hypothetical protein AAF573_13105 [Bacteroidota bacterium]
MKNVLKSEHGAENVNISTDEKEVAIIINAINQLIAIKENDVWYFIENKNPILLSNLIESETLNRLGIKIED